MKYFSMNRIAYIGSKKAEERTQEEQQYLDEYSAECAREQAERAKQQEINEKRKKESDEICRQYWAKLKAWEKEQNATTEPETGAFRLKNYSEVLELITDCYAYTVKNNGGSISEDSKKICSLVAFYLTAANEPKPWLYIQGYVGTGKSVLVHAIKHAFYSHANKVLPIVNATKINDIRKNDPDKWQRLLNTRFLCIDDFGTEQITTTQWGATESPVVDLIYHRYDKKLFTIFTSNNKLADGVEQHYGLRVADRLIEMCREIAMYRTTSYRQ